MLDIQGLPKNANGFRTTHTCELCGFEPKTKNKYREKQDHLVMKHFKERIDKIFPHCRPYSCPNTECSFEGKDKQALLRHYTGKHGVLELYLKEALLAKGINYHLSDSAKRKSMNNPNADHKAKMARLSPPISVTNVPVSNITSIPETTVLPTHVQVPVQVQAPVQSVQTLSLPPSPEQVLAQADTTTILPSEFTAYTTTTSAPSSIMLPTVPTTKLPSMSTMLTHKTKPVHLEVDALIASFEPQDYQVTATVYNPSPLVNCSQHQEPEAEQIVSSTTLDLPTLYLPVQQEDVNSKLPLILDNNIMWSSGSNSINVDTNQTVPAVFDSSDTAFINIGDIDYDYLYPATVDPAIVQQTITSNASTSPGSQTVLPFTDL